MAVNDAATLVIGSGNYLTAPTGTALPDDLLSPLSPWDTVGHTSLEDIFGITSEGGEATVLGTLQNKSLRTKYSARTETMTFTLQQFDTPALRLYFGANAPTLADGTLGVPVDPVPTICAFLVIFVDGDNYFGFYAPKAEIYRADDMELSDTESLAGLPIGVKPMVYAQNKWTYAITPLGESGPISATGATEGTPGAWTPSGSEAPASLTGLQSSGIVPTPLTAWAAGSYNLLSDGSTQVHWDGDSWESGPAV
ncbi:hypothetical protein ABZY93_22090 [Streptomyces smyrnaeus]|uniref:phage tail tube protein n=1 Tax=Streptomyces smyrnaeus TaxID=1387713 RepID=UPI0033AAC0F3